MELESAGMRVETRTRTVSSMVDEFRDYKERTGDDYILAHAKIWMEQAGDDPEIKSGVLQKVVGLVLEYRKSSVQDYYIQLLGKTYKPVKQWKDELKLQRENTDDTSGENMPGDDADTETLEKFGFYTEDNKYYFATPNNGFVEGTNFVMEPLYHIYSKDNNRRLLRIINEYGYSVLCDVPSAALVKVDTFQNFLYSEGNFLIFIQNNQFKKLLRYIGERFPKCSEMKTFGWQPEGFWAFANGIYNGRWTPVNKMGIMQHDGKYYFSPAFSEVYADLREDDDVYEADKRFVYIEASVTFTEWSRLMQRVYGRNGTYGVVYLLAALFRGIIYEIYKVFPHLFLHGEKGSGKSQLGWSLSNVFQRGQPPFNLNAGTDVAFFRWLGRYRNVVIWYDEYTDQIDEKRFQALKSAYDGVGREKGKMSRDSRTDSDKITSAAVISGQHLPQRDDNALYTRSIVRFFEKRQYTPEQIADYNMLKRTEDEGLSGITTAPLDYFKKFEHKFPRVFNEIFEGYKDQLNNRGIEVDDRILRNYTILAATAYIFHHETDLDIAVNSDVFREICLVDAIDQSEKVSSSDALSTFWKLFSGLVDENELTKNDYDIQEKWDETTVNKKNGEKVLETIKFNNRTRVLYINLDRVYQKYMEAHRRVFGEPGLGFQTIMDYSHHHASYIGLKSSHYFNNTKRTSAHMFDYGILVDSGILPEREIRFGNEDSDKTIPY